MQHLPVTIDKAEEFDDAVHNSLQDGGDLKILTKRAATQGGRAAVCLTFSVEVDGKIERVQTVTTARLFIMASRAVEGAHGIEGDR